MKRSVLSAVLFTSLSILAVGCVAPTNEATDTATSDIVNVPQTDVERQSIGNCWLYAEASWVESMHLAATGRAFDSSQSYWTYWHWFEQISAGYGDSISTGGSWMTANGLVRRYGLMAERDFIATDTESEMSGRQKSALAALNTALKSGALSTDRARRDRHLVRVEMDRAWGLSSEQSMMLDRVFGRDVDRTFDGSRPASSTNSTIIRADEFEVAYTRGGAESASVKTTLSRAMGEWSEAYYYGDQRAFLKRVQRALHDEQPVIISWFVDFNAMENRQSSPLRGSFNIDTLREQGPGHQGGHMTVLEDYQAILSDGTVLEAGKTLSKERAADRALLARALDNTTQVQFLRVKNSWGSARPDRTFAPGMPGYHDLYMNYLGASIRRCKEVNGETNTSDCPYETTPLQGVVLPPGY